MTGIARVIGVLAALLAGAASVAAQPLADVARKEQARREAVQASGKTYTNEDLTPDPHGVSPAPPDSEPPATTVSAAGDSGDDDPPPSGDEGAAAEADTAPAANALDEAFWRRRATALRGRVAVAERALEKVSDTSQQDPRMRARMDQLRTDAEGVLTRAQEALAAFLRQAAEQGVPAAWLEP